MSRKRRLRQKKTSLNLEKTRLSREAHEQALYSLMTILQSNSLQVFCRLAWLCCSLPKKKKKSQHMISMSIIIILTSSVPHKQDICKIFALYTTRVNQGSKKISLMAQRKYLSFFTISIENMSLLEHFGISRVSSPAFDISDNLHQVQESPLQREILVTSCIPASPHNIPTTYLFNSHKNDQI